MGPQAESHSRGLNTDTALSQAWGPVVQGQGAGQPASPEVPVAMQVASPVLVLMSFLCAGLCPHLVLHGNQSCWARALPLDLIEPSPPV